MKNTENYLKRILCLLAVLLLLPASGCASFDSFRQTFIEKDMVDEDVIYIGVYEPRTGSLEKQGRDEIRGIELAHSIYNNVKGARIELVTIDTQSDTSVSKSAIQDLIRMNPIAIIGSAGEASSMIASPYIRDAEIPTITPSAVNPLITEGNSWYFRACITEDQRGEGLAEYAAREIGADSAAVITIENDSKEAAIADGFRAGMKKYSGQKRPIVLSREISVDDVELTGLSDRIRGSGAQAVFMPVGAAKADLIFTQMEEAGLTDLVYLGGQEWNSEEFVRMMENHPDIQVAFPSDTVVMENYDTMDTVTAETQRFLIEYANRYGDVDRPTESTVLGYDAYLLVVNAINSARSFDRKDVREALAGTEGLRCATGVFTFNEDGNPVRTVNISTIREGEIVAAYVTNEVSEAGQMAKISK